MKDKDSIIFVGKHKASINDIQYLLSKGIEIHPVTYYTFITALADLTHGGKVCLTPIGRLEEYSIRKRKCA